MITTVAGLILVLWLYAAVAAAHGPTLDEYPRLERRVRLGMFLLLGCIGVLILIHELSELL